MLDCFKLPEEISVRVDRHTMQSLIEAIFRSFSMPENAARAATDVLLYADLRGIDSHGVSNMMPSYVAGFRDKRINPNATMSCTEDYAGTLSFNCDRGLGLAQGGALMEIAMARAKEQGIAFVTGYNGSHYGACAYYVHQAVRENLIGISMTTGSLKVLPTFGAEQLVGLNPLGFGVPTGTEIPFIFDAAMSSVASNKIKTLQRLDHEVLPGWISDDLGTPLMKPTKIPDEFMILPLGGTREIGSHKGFSLAMMIEILCGVLTGTGGGPHRRQGNAHCFVALDVERFTDMTTFKADVDCYLRSLLECKPAPGEDRVIYAGVLEHEAERDRTKRGIPYHPEVIFWLRHLANELDIEHGLPR